MGQMITCPGAAPYWVDLASSDNFQIYSMSVPWRDEPPDEEELAMLALTGKLAALKRKRH